MREWEYTWNWCVRTYTIQYFTYLETLKFSWWCNSQWPGICWYNIFKKMSDTVTSWSFLCLTTVHRPLRASATEVCWVVLQTKCVNEWFKIIVIPRLMLSQLTLFCTCHCPQLQYIKTCKNICVYDAQYVFELLNSHDQELALDDLVENQK